MEQIKGFAVICNKDLNIVRTIRDDFNILSPELNGITFLKLVEKGSIDKAFSFFNEIKLHNAAFNWEINLNFTTHFDTSYLTGVRANENILIIATRELQNINQFLNQYQNIFSEQTNLIRSAVKEKHEEVSTNIYNEFSRINNELTDLHRDISKKNVLLNKQRKHLELINRILRHDLANFFAVIGSSLRLYNRAKDISYLDMIHTTVQRGISLIRNMKQLESIFSDSTELEATDLLEIFEDLVEHYPNINFTVDLPEVKVLADSGCDIIFDNLIRNSIRHGEAKNIQIRGELLDNRFFLRFSDDGKGIPDSIKDKIFEENFTAGKKGNTGLGLYIVERMMFNYRGSVKVEDNLPRGTVFILEFKTI